jgi:hypothetical protein
LNIEWAKVIPTFITALIGALTGGGITWFSAKKSLEKQFDFEMKMKKINNLKTTCKSLISIYREIYHNKSECEILLATLNNEVVKKDAIIKLKGNDLNLTNDSWKKFNQEINDFEYEGDTSEISLFYSIISVEIRNNNTNRERLEFFIKKGEEITKNLDKNIKLIKNKIKKLEEISS